jgi:hypothetical protein
MQVDVGDSEEQLVLEHKQLKLEKVKAPSWRLQVSIWEHNSSFLSSQMAVSEGPHLSARNAVGLLLYLPFL